MIKDIIQNVYSKRPLVHNITNYVAATDCANITLTIGASPIMADEPKEVGEVTQIADGLVLNCGTISESRLNAMLISGKTSKSREIPIVLDPVGVGISKFRTSAVHKIITEVKPDIIRLNASELKSICLNIKNMSGVDAVNIDSLDDTVELAKKLSGAYDYPERAKQAIREMFRQVGPCKFDSDGILKSGLVVRHMVLPGFLENSYEVIDWFAEAFPKGEVLFSLMSQYTPPQKPLMFKQLNRRLTTLEYNRVYDYMLKKGIERGFCQERSSAKEEYTPKFDLSGV